MLDSDALRGVHQVHIMTAQPASYWTPKWRAADGRSLKWGAADGRSLKSCLLRTQSLKGSPFQAWSTSVYSHTCYAYCQGFLPSYSNFYPSGPFTCTFFSKTAPEFFPMLALANTGSCVNPQNKIGQPARCRLPYVPADYK